MKNIWKERWDSCNRCFSRETLTRYSDKVSALAHAVLTCGLEPLREDWEVLVKKLCEGSYMIYSEAPHSQNGLKGMAVRAIVQVSSRGKKKLVKLVEARSFFPSEGDASKDYYIVKEWDRAIAMDSDPFLQQIMDKLEGAVQGSEQNNEFV